jgi:hypothetical protein
VDGVFTQCPDDAATAQNDFLHGVIVGEHRDDDIALAHAGWAIRDFRTLVSAPGAVEYKHTMARLQQVALVALMIADPAKIDELAVYIQAQNAPRGRVKSRRFSRADTLARALPLVKARHRLPHPSEADKADIHQV